LTEWSYTKKGSWPSKAVHTIGKRKTRIASEESWSFSKQSKGPIGGTRSSETSQRRLRSESASEGRSTDRRRGQKRRVERKKKEALPYIGKGRGERQNRGIPLRGAILGVDPFLNTRGERKPKGQRTRVLGRFFSFKKDLPRGLEQEKPKIRSAKPYFGEKKRGEEGKKSLLFC